MALSQPREKIRVQVTYRFPRAQQNVRDEFGASRGDSPADRLILGGVGTGSTGIDVLEDLVETKLAEALEGIANKSRQESNAEALGTFCCSDLSKAIANTGVQTRVSLNEVVSIKSECDPEHH